ncbi:MAG: HEAT repeat domain-containing protein [Armatimonadota bacterium]
MGWLDYLLGWELVKTALPCLTFGWIALIWYLQWRYPDRFPRTTDPAVDWPENLELYEQVLQGPNRKRALRKLIAHRTPDAVRLLCRIVGQAQPELAQEAARGLVRIGKTAVPQIAGVVQDTASPGRARLIGVLSEIADPAAVPALCSVLAEERSALHGPAAQALLRTARKRRGPVLSSAAPLFRRLVETASAHPDPNLPLYRKLLQLTEFEAEAPHLPIPGHAPSTPSQDLPRPAREPSSEDLPLPQRARRSPEREAGGCGGSPRPTGNT